MKKGVEEKNTQAGRATLSVRLVQITGGKKIVHVRLRMRVTSLNVQTLTNSFSRFIFRVWQHWLLKSQHL